MSSDSLESEHWNEASEQYLTDLIEQCSIRITEEQKKELLYMVLKHILQIPIIIVNCIIAVVEEDTSNTLIKVTLLTSSLLTSLNYYFDASRRRYMHLQKKNRLVNLINRIKVILATDRNRRKSARNTLESLNIELASIAKIDSNLVNSPIKP